MDQVLDYALDLKNFHEASHAPPIAPVLIATAANEAITHVEMTAAERPASVSDPEQHRNSPRGHTASARIHEGAGDRSRRVGTSRYSPTPTIVEAATALYGGHGVEEISRTDAGAINLSRTSAAVSRIICECRARSEKSICFVTGVPGAGKTLVGLKIATQHIDKENEEYSVFLSGNGPLVAILREALARDKVAREGAGETSAESRGDERGEDVHPERPPLSRRLPGGHGSSAGGARGAIRRGTTGMEQAADLKLHAAEEGLERIRPVGARVPDFLPRSSPRLGGDRLSGGRWTGDQHRRSGHYGVDRIARAPVPELERLHLPPDYRRRVRSRRGRWKR